LSSRIRPCRLARAEVAPVMPGRCGAFGKLGDCRDSARHVSGLRQRRQVDEPDGVAIVVQTQMRQRATVLWVTPSAWASAAWESRNASRRVSGGYYTPRISVCVTQPRVVCVTAPGAGRSASAGVHCQPVQPRNTGEVTRWTANDSGLPSYQ
jgi:hypothetical protein